MFPEVGLWSVEVGFRAALATETRSRDLRWFTGLWTQHTPKHVV